MKSRLIQGIALLAIAVAGQAFGELLFYEGFDYSEGVLSTVSSGAWVQKSGQADDYWTVADAMVGGSLGFETNGAVLETSGRAARAYKQSGVNSSGPNGTRTGVITKQNTGVLWASWLAANLDGAGSWGGTHGLMLREAGSDNDWSQNRVLFGWNHEGNPNFDNPDTWLRTDPGSSVRVNHTGYVRVPPDTAEQAFFYVVKVDYDNQEVTFWLNPEPGLAAPANHVLTVTRAFEAANNGDMEFDQVKLVTAWAGALHNDLYYDEIRVGESYIDVAPKVQPEQPSGTVIVVQ